MFHYPQNMVTKWGLSLLSPNQTLNNQLIKRIFKQRKNSYMYKSGCKVSKKIIYSKSSEVMSRQVSGLMFSLWWAIIFSRSGPEVARARARRTCSVTSVVA